MQLNFTHNGRVYSGWSTEKAVASGVPLAVVGAASKDAAIILITELIEDFRTQLANVSARKIVEWNIKAEIPADPASADAVELALVERGGVARGRNQADELAAILAKRSAYRKAALLIGALEDESEASIAALSDEDPDLSAEIMVILERSRAEVEVGISGVMELIAAG